jgi:hypothetical protein
VTLKLSLLTKVLKVLNPREQLQNAALHTQNGEKCLGVEGGVAVTTAFLAAIPS